MVKQYLFKIKEGKLQQWKDWCDYLIAHADEVRATMLYEQSNREMFTLFTFDGIHMVVGHGEFFNDPVQADMTVLLNIEHRRNLRECLERVGSAEILYDLRA